MAAGFFRGTSFEQDARFSNKWKKLLSSTKFPEIYSQPVETKLVQLDSIRTWVARKLQQLLGFEDEVSRMVLCIKGKANS
jgi:serine/arginine repetitive matrix protein 1